ncbi:MAG: class II fructose-bisphosphate aldolase [Thermodesulfobacteriota bacterium]|nr:class II fructose-bisphosphate aldolase [Thermodesulfobacteriota bacterium]
MPSKETIDRVLDLRPERVKEKLGSSSRVCLLNSKDILRVLKDREVIIMACNTRIKHAVPGIMKAAEELDAVVAFELAKSEGDVDGGYTGQNPKIYFETVIGYADERGFTKPFFIHGDHITVKDTSTNAIESARNLISEELKAGYTSFAIDASFNPVQDNIRITKELAQPIVNEGIGLEVEVGEIKAAGSEGTITTVEDALEFIQGLNEKNIHPDFLAINNGSKHGNYLEGEEISIDLQRTGEVYEAVKSYGVVIAQHGITGTPLNLVGRFADYGIRKGNVGTIWQNVVHEGLPEELMARMRTWAKDQGKDIKFATKPFKAEIDSINKEYADPIETKAYEEAKSFIKAFRAVGTASMVFDGLGR